MEAASEASYCERETWDEWGSRSSLSQVEEVASQSSGREDVTSLRAERDALARALAAERARAATAARAHDARLAELHGVIAELVRRRAHDKNARAIPEEDVSDECESTTQPAGELDNDADNSRTEQNDTSSALSPELPTPQESKVENTMPASTFEELPTDTETSVNDIRTEAPHVEVTTPTVTAECDTSLNLSDRDSDLCLSTARCCEDVEVGAGGGGGGGGAGEGCAGGSCERERGSPDSPTLYIGACAPRGARLAARVTLRTAQHAHCSAPRTPRWLCGGEAGAERLALDVSAHGGLREDLLAAAHQHNGDGGACEWAVRCARVRAERRVLRCALARAADTAHRLYCACAIQESTSVSLCCALRAADRALETYDVLLALAETAQQHTEERQSTEQVASQLLARLDAEQECTAIGEPLLSPGPWQQQQQQQQHRGSCEAWDSASEARLRAHAARLKADTVLLRATQTEPKMFSYHDVEESSLEGCSAAEMEAAVAVHDALAHAHTHAQRNNNNNNNNADGEHKSGSSSRRRARSRPRHWLDAQASETDL